MICVCGHDEDKHNHDHCLKCGCNVARHAVEVVVLRDKLANIYAFSQSKSAPPSTVLETIAEIAQPAKRIEKNVCPSCHHTNGTHTLNCPIGG